MDEIFRRGECRNFKELTPVPDEQLLTLVKAGMQARSVGNQKDRDFIIVTREDLVKAISHNSIVAGPARKASAAIVIVGKKEGVSFLTNGPSTAQLPQKTSCSKRNTGLGSLWLQVYPYQDRKIHLCNILDIPTELDPFCIVVIGYAERKPVVLNRFDEREVSYDLYTNHKK